MKILIIGATGNAGSRILTEALRRGHDVTAAARRLPLDVPGSPCWPALRLDAADPAQVAGAAGPHDVIIDATRPAPGQESQVGATTLGLTEGARRAGRRLVVVGGASPLFLPGRRRRVLDDPAWVPSEVRHLAVASLHQLQILQASADLDWTYLAPAAVFGPGPRTGSYRTGGDQLVIDSAGESIISMEDYAIAALDELETPTTSRAVLSVGS